MDNLHIFVWIEQVCLASMVFALDLSNRFIECVREYLLVQLGGVLSQSPVCEHVRTASPSVRLYPISHVYSTDVLKS